METTESNDALVREDVIEEMEYDPAVRVEDIAVLVRDGVVTLRGVADSYGTRSAAVMAAWRTSGVVNVIDEVIVDPKMLGMPTDAEIAADVRKRLEDDFLVPKGQVDVSVRDGVVTLSGKVKLHLNREAAREEAKFARGVRDVVNLITIEHSGASPASMEASIKKALTRNAQLEAKDVQVSVDEGTVILTGKLHSYAERQEAENAAWRARGTTDVIDRIAIEPY